MRNIKKKDFEEIFHGCKYGQECSKKITKFVIEYKLEKTKNKVDYDHIVFHVEDYKEPIPFGLLQHFLSSFKLVWGNMYWKVTLKDNPNGGREDYIQYSEVLDNHTPVYYIDFHQLDDLIYLKYFLNDSAL